MNLMHDPSHPDPEDGIAENLVDATSARQVVLRMEFVPIGKGETITKRKRFPTAAAANEYMLNALPANPKTAIGSPKQLHARRARYLGVDAQWLAAHNLICHLEMEYPVNAEPNRGAGQHSEQPNGPAAGTQPSRGSPVHSGPPSADLLRSILDSESLSVEEVELPEGGDDEAEDGGEIEESET